MDPNQFVIKRRRKKYKFAKFYNAPNCFEFDAWSKLPSDVIELGAGTGLFSVEMARLHPEWVVTAIDVKADRLQRGAYLALEQNIPNVNFLRARADQIGELFTTESVETIWLTFPDPFPRERSAGRRLTHPNFLSRYTEILKSTGSLCLKHDNPEFFAWSIEQLEATGWKITEQTYDLHNSDLPKEYKILTSYEQRWLAEGRQTHFVRAMKPSK